MQDKFLLGIDAGTSVVKSVLFNLEGKEISIARRKVSILTPRQGWAEQDMDDAWEKVKETIFEAVEKASISSSSIAGIGVTGQGDGCRLIDEDYRPLRPAILWLDGRAGDIVTEWEKKGYDEEAFRVSGHTTFAGSPAALIRWLAENETENLKKAKAFLFAKDWVKFKLTGTLSTDPSDASEMPLDLKNISYSQDLFRLFGISEHVSLFPEIVFSSNVIGETTREAAEECNLQEGTPVIAGMIDVVATAVGLGVVREGQAYSILGTTSFNGVLSEEPLFSPRAGMNFVYAFPEKIVRSMASMAGTPNLDWSVKNLCAGERKEKEEEEFYRFLEERMEEIPPGAEGIIYHPYISPGGERAPFVKPTAKAQFFGVSLRHTRWHLLRAVYEGVALSILDCFRHISVEVDEVRLSGGGAKSSIWPKILSDVLGVPVRVSLVSELGSLGAAMTAGIAVGVYSRVEEAADKVVKLSATYYPDKENHRLYGRLYELYRSICQHVWDDWDRRDQILKILQK